MDYNSKQDISKEDIKEFLKESKDISIQEQTETGRSQAESPADFGGIQPCQPSCEPWRICSPRWPD